MSNLLEFIKDALTVSNVDNQSTSSCQIWDIPKEVYKSKKELEFLVDEGIISSFMLYSSSKLAHVKLIPVKFIAKTLGKEF